MATAQQENVAIQALQRKLKSARKGLAQERAFAERVAGEWDAMRPAMEAGVSQLKSAIVALGGTPAAESTDDTDEIEED